MSEETSFYLKSQAEYENFVAKYKGYEEYDRRDDNLIIALVEAGIFTFRPDLLLIDSMEVTTKLFKQLSKSQLLRKVKKLVIDQIAIDDKAFSYLSRTKGMRLEELNISRCPNVGDKGLCSYFSSPAARNMKKLVFDKLEIENTTIVTIINNHDRMKNLSHLEIKSCKNIGDDALKNLFFKNFRNLKSLCLEGIKFSDIFLNSIAINADLLSLEKLKLVKNKKATEAGFERFLGSQYLKNLTFLHLESLLGCTGKALNALVKPKPKLTELYIGTTEEITNDEFIEFSKAGLLSTVTDFTLNDCSEIDNEAIIEFFDNPSNVSFKNVRMCDLYEPNGIAFVKIFGYTKNPLENISITGCTDFADITANKAILNNWNLEMLINLDLSNCAILSPTFFQNLKNLKLTNLQEIRISENPLLNDIGITYLAKCHKNIKSLKRLYIENCSSVNNRAFEELVKSNLVTDLLVLSVQHCSELDDELADNFVKSKLTKLKELHLQGTSITSGGVDTIIYSDLMKTIEYLGLSDGCLAFPAFYLSKNCTNLKKIDGSFEGVSKDDIINLFKSQYLGKDFDFSDISTYIPTDDEIIMALADSDFQTKVLYLPLNDISAITSESLIQFISSTKLHPFFDIDSLIKECKSLIKDEMLIAMAKNPLCVNNLYNLDLAGTKGITENGIISFLTSPHLCATFDIAEFFSSIRMKFQRNPENIIEALPKCKFAENSKVLDFTEYWITDEIMQTLIKNPNPFKSLKHLIINETHITQASLEILTNWEYLPKITFLSISDHRKIEIEAWEEFFTKIVGQEMDFKNLELEFLRINNHCMELLASASWAMNLEKLSISGCTLIDYDGLVHVVKIKEKYRKMDMTDVYEDFKQFFIEKEDGSFYLTKEVNIELDEVIEFLLNPSYIDYKQRKKKLSQIRDNITEEFLRSPRISKIQKLDLHSAGITSKTCFSIANSEYCSNMKEIIFNDTMIEDDGIEALANSENMRNIEALSIKGCYYLTDQALLHVVQCKFSRKFNFDTFITQFAEYLDTNLLQKIVDSPLVSNCKKIDITAAKDLTIEDLTLILEMQQKASKLLISVNLSGILAANISDVNDEILNDISNSPILAKIKDLNLTGAQCTAEGLRNLILSPYINSQFSIQPIIVSHSAIIDDNILNAISRSRFFKNVSTIDLDECPNITNIGLLYIIRSPNKYFDIQKIIDDNAESIDVHFINTIIQQDYFEALERLNLSKCTKLKSPELIKCIENFGEDFDIESFIDVKNIPGRKADLITNDVIQAVTNSMPYNKKFRENNPTDPEERNYFDFNIRLFRHVDYGINYLIEDDTAPLEDYDDYLQHYLSFLNIFSIDSLIKLCDAKNKEILDQMENVARLDFGQNNHLYSMSYKNLLIDAFDHFQNSHFMNLERETIGVFCEKIIKLEAQFGYSRKTEDEIDLMIVQMLKYTPNVEELILSNQNIGDTFLKKLSILLDNDEVIHLPKLRVLRIKNNPRFTAIGLKYLFVAALKRKSVDEIDVYCNEQGDSGVTYFVNNGLYGLMGFYVLEVADGYRLAWKKNKGRPIPFLFDLKTLKTTLLFLLFLGPFIFHGFEVLLKKLMFCIPKIMPKCQGCKKACTGCIQSMFDLCRKGNDSDEEKQSEKISNKLLLRYRKINDSLENDLTEKQRFKLRGKLLFYFDEAFYTLNAMLSGSISKIKKNLLKDGTSINEGYSKVIPSESLIDDDDDEKERLTKGIIDSKHSYLLSNLKWVFLINFIVYYGIIFGYSMYVRYDICKFSTIDQVLIQIPYFCYILISLFLEFIIMYEISRVINNSLIVSWKSVTTIFSLIDSQAAKYDFYTDVNFILENYWCNNMWVFWASAIIIGITSILNLSSFQSFMKKVFFKKKMSFHSTKFINLYSKLCFVQEMYAVGKILDRFSTSSATKFTGWYVPTFLQNVYIPLIILSTFQRLFIEDIPQLIIQLIALFIQGKSLSNFSTLTALLSTVVNLLLTLHTAWNVKPSYFSRDMFKIYYDIVNKQYKKETGRDDLLSETESDDLSSSWRDTTDMRISDTDINYSNNEGTFIRSSLRHSNKEEVVLENMKSPGEPS